MSPEVTRHEPYNTKTDVYSFGIMMYEIFSRQMLSTTAEAADPGVHVSMCTWKAIDVATMLPA